MEARDVTFVSGHTVAGVSCSLGMPDDHQAISSLQARLGGKGTS